MSLSWLMGITGGNEVASPRSLLLLAVSSCVLWLAGLPAGLVGSRPVFEAAVSAGTSLNSLETRELALIGGASSKFHITPEWNSGKSDLGRCKSSFHSTGKKFVCILTIFETITSESRCRCENTAPICGCQNFALHQLPMVGQRFCVEQSVRLLFEDPAFVVRSAATRKPKLQALRFCRRVLCLVRTLLRLIRAGACPVSGR